MQEPIEDSPEYLTRWADEFADAVSQDELDKAIKSDRREADRARTHNTTR